MSEEDRYRVESPEEEEKKEKRGLLRPLPKVEQQTTSKGVPIVNFLGLKMEENRRDLLVSILMPILVAIIDASIYAQIIIDVFTDEALFVFFLPMLAAIPIGLTVPQAGKALLSGFLAAIFFVVFFLLFLITPGLLVPEVGIGEFLVSGGVVSAIYFLFVVMASLLGVVIGIVIREFF
ncbi:hypothetical protein EU538_02485 [Candidatus Thorarchaeota archaeon]|nr:MAG: hypothetical protein EU538_02485 [Candidatus Thorarchaeota archaeon]